VHQPHCRARLSTSDARSARARAHALTKRDSIVGGVRHRASPIEATDSRFEGDFHSQDLEHGDAGDDISRSSRRYADVLASRIAACTLDCSAIAHVATAICGAGGEPERLLTACASGESAANVAST